MGVRLSCLRINYLTISFAAGRSTALVIESGAANTSIVPVFDGYVVKKAIQKAPIGGDFISNQVFEYLKQMNIDLTPQTLIASKEAVSSSAPPKFARKNISGLTASYMNYQLGVI